MKNIDISKLIETCDHIQRTTIYAGKEYYHVSSKILYDCMKGFEKHPEANFVTINVYWNAPFMKPGTVTINRDGTIAGTTGLEQ